MIREILSDGTEQALNIPDVSNRFFGFDGKESCAIGKLSLIVRSSVDSRYDLVYIDTPTNYKIGFLYELRPVLNGC